MNSFLNKVDTLLKSDVFFSLRHFDVIGDKVEICYDASLGNERFYDLCQVVPVDEIFSYPALNESDRDEREAMMDQEVRTYLDRQAAEQQNFLNTINVESWKIQNTPAL